MCKSMIVSVKKIIFLTHILLGYKDTVLNKVTAFSFFSGLDVSLRYAQKKADIQTASKDHDYLRRSFLEY